MPWSRRLLEQFEPVADRIASGTIKSLTRLALLGQRAGAARDRHAGLLQPRRDRIEGGGIRHLPAEEADALAAVRIDDDALLADRPCRNAMVRALLSMRCRPSILPP